MLLFGEMGAQKLISIVLAIEEKKDETIEMDRFESSVKDLLYTY